MGKDNLAGLNASVRTASRSILRVRFGSLRFYVILLIIAVSLHFINKVLFQMPFSQPLPDKEVALEFQKKQLDIWAEMNKLLITLATLTAGAVGGLMLNRDKTTPFPVAQTRRAAASWIFCALSLYFGYLAYNEATWMLSLGTFNSYNPRLWWPIQAQFWCFLISVIIFADFIYGSIRYKNETGR